MSNASWLTVSMPEGIEAMTIRPDIPHQRLTDEEFEQSCTQNPELRIEMTVNLRRAGGTISASAPKVHDSLT
jgi:hypothetical protein